MEKFQQECKSLIRNLKIDTSFRRSNSLVNLADLDHDIKGKWILGHSGDKWLNFGFVYAYNKLEFNRQYAPIFFSFIDKLCAKYNVTAAGLSWLKPMSCIPWHKDGCDRMQYGVHYGILVPSNCCLVLKDKIITEETGKLFYFDDSDEHMAYNHSYQERVILYMKIQFRSLEELQELISKPDYLFKN